MFGSGWQRHNRNQNENQITATPTAWAPSVHGTTCLPGSSAVAIAGFFVGSAVRGPGGHDPPLNPHQQICGRQPPPNSATRKRLLHRRVLEDQIEELVDFLASWRPIRKGWGLCPFPSLLMGFRGGVGLPLRSPFGDFVGFLL